MRGRDFLGTCAALAAASDEAAVRTRISRAYYAAYLEARTFCETHLEYDRSKQGREHQDVPRLLQPIDQEVVSRLTFLRQLRNTADYDLEISEATMGRSVSGAESFANVVISALDGHARRMEREEQATLTDDQGGGDSPTEP